MTGEESYRLANKYPTEFNKQNFLLWHIPYLFSAAYRILPAEHREEIEDVVSDIYLKLLKRNAIDYSKDYMEIKGYLSKTVLNHCLRYLQEKRNKETTEFEDWKLIVQKEPDTRLTDLIEEIKTWVDDTDRQIIRQYLKGYTFGEIGKQHGTSRQRVHQRMQEIGKVFKRRYQRIK